MSKYNDLPIFKVSYDLMVLITQAVTNFPRGQRFSLGEKLNNAVIDLLILIYKANSTDEKLMPIQAIREQVQLVYILLKISLDLKILPVEKYTNIVQKVDEISSQAACWYKSTEKSSEKNNENMETNYNSELTDILIIKEAVKDGKLFNF